MGNEFEGPDWASDDNEADNIGIFEDCLVQLRRAPIKELARMSKRLDSMLTQGKIDLEAASFESASTSPLTEFTLRSDPIDPPLLYLTAHRDINRVAATLPLPTLPMRQALEGVEITPLLLVNPLTVRTSGLGEVIPDLLRTVAVADQFPDKGYSSRITDVYSRALKKQAQWLNTLHIPIQANLDPRALSEEEIKVVVIHRDEYYSDVGLEDWNVALDELSAVSSEAKQDVINVLRDPSMFMGLRTLYLPGVHEHLSDKFGVEGYKKIEKEHRVRMVARHILRRTLFGRESSL